MHGDRESGHRLPYDFLYSQWASRYISTAIQVGKIFVIEIIHAGKQVDSQTLRLYWDS